MSVWRDGRLLGESASRIARDRGLLLGDGLFETVLVREGRAPRLPSHLARLARSAAALGLPCPDELEDDVRAALSALLGDEEPPARAALRVTLSRGAGRGLEPPSPASAHLTVSLDGLVEVAAGVPAPAVRARLVATHRIDPDSALAGHKTLSWLPWVMARRAARAAGADVALVATIDGDVCESDAANVFAVVGDEIVTPPLDRGVLPGLTRARALVALRGDGRAVVERRLGSAELRGAREAFLTSSLDLVRPLAAVDGVEMAAPGRVASWLAACL